MTESTATFEALESELRQATERLEDASVPLEERLTLHARAASLHQQLEAALDRARRALEQPVETGEAGDERYEKLRDRLAETVTELEKADLPLARVVKLHRRARQLAARCETILKAAQQRVEATSGKRVEPEDAWGVPATEPDADEDPLPF